MDAAGRELEQIGVTEIPEVVVADAGYWHQVQMENIAGRPASGNSGLRAGKRLNHADRAVATA